MDIGSIPLVSTDCSCSMSLKMSLSCPAPAGFRVGHLDAREMSDALDVAESKGHFVGGFRGRGWVQERDRKEDTRPVAAPGWLLGNPFFC